MPFFKVFLGAQLLLGLGVAFLLARAARRSALARRRGAGRRSSRRSSCSARAARRVAVRLAPLDLVRVTRETLGLAPVDGLALVAAALRLAVPLARPSRLVGLPDALRALRGPTLGSALAAMALCGWPLGLLLRVSAPEVLAGQKVVNDAAYLVEQSGPLLWVFAALGLARFATSRARRAVVVAALLLFATARDLSVRRQEGPHGARPHAGADGARDGRARHGFEPGRRRAPAARRPLAAGARGARRPPRALRALHAVLDAVRGEGRPRGAPRDGVPLLPYGGPAEAMQIARSLGASYLALYGSDRVRFDTAGLLETVYEEEGARVYRILAE